MVRKRTNVQDVLDYEIYSKIDLNTAQSFRFFNENDQNANGNIDQPSVIDANADYMAHYLDVNFLATDGDPLEDTDIALIASILKETWINFQINTAAKVWIASLSSIVRFPMAVAAAGASAYNPVGIVNGSYKFNVPLLIPGGQNINVTLNRQTATNYSGITMELVLLGIVNRSMFVAR